MKVGHDIEQWQRSGKLQTITARGAYSNECNKSLLSQKLASLSEKEEHSGILSKTGRSRSRLKELPQVYGLRLDTIHGPRADQPDSLNHLTAVAETAAECAAPIVVMHRGPFDFGQE